MDSPQQVLLLVKTNCQKKMDKQVRKLLVNNVELNFGNCIPRLKISEIHNWLSQTCGVRDEDHEGSMPIFQAPTQVLRVKFVSDAVFKLFLDKWAGYHSVVVKSKEGERTVRVRVFDARDVAIFVSIGDVPFEIELDEVREVMAEFGRVERVERRSYQGAGFLKGKQGWITTSIILEKPIPSYVDIGYCRAVVKYEGQDTTCKGCNEIGHWQRDCPNSVWAKRIKERQMREERKRKQEEEEERKKIEMEKEREARRREDEEKERKEREEAERLKERYDRIEAEEK